MFTSILNAFSSGGIWMVAILAVQIVSLAIIIERAIVLYMFRKESQRKLVYTFESKIKRGELAKANKLADKYGIRNPIGYVMKAGTQAALDMGGREEIQARIDEVLLNENSKLEQRTGFLAMLANVATLLGLLGTIIGLIQSFASVGGDISAAAKASMLTQGIAMAMNTTAYGLIVAIPALVSYAILQNRVEQLQHDLNQSALRAYNWLIFNFDKPSKVSIRKKN